MGRVEVLSIPRRRPSLIAAAILAEGVVSSSAWAVCATTGAAPVTLTCGGAVTTTITANSTSPNPNTSDLIQSFNERLSATVNAGATITGAGLAPSSTLNGSTVSLTNNGSIPLLRRQGDRAV
jgi:hypothetical protein